MSYGSTVDAVHRAISARIAARITVAQVALPCNFAILDFKASKIFLSSGVRSMLYFVVFAMNVLYA